MKAIERDGVVQELKKARDNRWTLFESRRHVTSDWRADAQTARKRRKFVGRANVDKQDRRPCVHATKSSDTSNANFDCPGSDNLIESKVPGNQAQLSSGYG
jgi:hypothetical protein